uniref:protein-disulfide reductase n=1 Tax=Araucaria cunninghamii TaxID=56994 RepID=A0A0D6R0U7_ARACU
MAEDLRQINSIEIKNCATGLPLKNKDFLLINSSRQPVQSSVLEGKLVGILIGPHWLVIPLQHALSVLSESYQELLREGKDVIFVYVAADRDHEVIETLKRYGQENQIDERSDAKCFDKVLGILPKNWLAVPFEQSDVRAELINSYRSGIFSLAFVGFDGKLHTKDGLKLLEKWGVDSYPFTEERIQQLHRQALERTANQCLKSLLTTETRDFLTTPEGKEVKVAELEGKIVGLYFAAHWYHECQTFTSVLADIYKQLKEQGAEFEIIFISSDEDRVSFENYHRTMPWFAVPYSDLKTKKMLNKTFEVEALPCLIMLDKHGKTMQTESVELIYKYGIRAFPFTPERLTELEFEERAKHASQTLETLLATNERNYVIAPGRTQVSISFLVGKTVGLYFSAQWCFPCQKFTPRLISVYNKLKDTLKGDEGFEIIFISSDRDEASFFTYYETMPWLALPYGDEKSRELSRYFDIRGIPSLVIVGPDGKTVTNEGRKLINLHWERAYPFVEAHLAEIQKEIDEAAKCFTKTILHAGHGHILDLVSGNSGGGPYICCECDEQGSGWAYQCLQCGYEVHPACVQDSKNQDQKPPNDECSN